MNEIIKKLCTSDLLKLGFGDFQTLLLEEVNKEIQDLNRIVKVQQEELSALQELIALLESEIKASPTPPTHLPATSITEVINQAKQTAAPVTPGFSMGGSPSQSTQGQAQVTRLPRLPIREDANALLDQIVVSLKGNPNANVKTMSEEERLPRLLANTFIREIRRGAFLPLPANWKSLVAVYPGLYHHVFVSKVVTQEDFLSYYNEARYKLGQQRSQRIMEIFSGKYAKQAEPV